jgi:hypothetical protein
MSLGLNEFNESINSQNGILVDNHLFHHVGQPIMQVNIGYLVNQFGNLIHKLVSEPAQKKRYSLILYRAIRE